jgi:hypothetical protein
MTYTRPLPLRADIPGQAVIVTSKLLQHDTVLYQVAFILLYIKAALIY